MEWLKKVVTFEFFDSIWSCVAVVITLFASGAFLIDRKPEHMWWLIAMQFLNYAIIIVFTVINAIINKRVVMRSRDVLLLLIFAIGCFINFKYHLIATIILFGSNFCFYKLKQIRKFRYNSAKHKFLSGLSQLLCSKGFFYVSQVLLIFLPYVLFGGFWFSISTIDIAVRIVFFLLCLLCIPVVGGLYISQGSWECLLTDSVKIKFAVSLLINRRFCLDVKIRKRGVFLLKHLFFYNFSQKK